ncbi:hypothetical protein QJS66_16510 [Kocuria rhizophila]|nr:hypothetical protein QJS66_16510 [Kocuria rhizophila]
MCDPSARLTLEDLGVLRVRVWPGGRDGGGHHPHLLRVPRHGHHGRGGLEAAVTAAGYENVRVVQVLRPAWTTDWMSAEGRASFNEYGIAPPTGRAAAGHNSGPVRLSLAVKCPRCESLRAHR